jgi:hypothetical protein
MENIENLVTEVTENVEITTEEIPVKTYTQEEVNDMMGKRLARQEAKIRKEYDRKYGELTEVLEAGTGKKGVDELKDTFHSFYASKGVQMPKKPEYSAKDIEVLAKADAAEFINGGFEEVVEEVDRLAAIGVDKMTARDKALFKELATYRQKEERGRELSKLGVTEDVYTSEEFKAFASQFNPNTPITDVYNIYAKTLPRKEHKVMGSMKNTGMDTGVKDHYSPEEISKLSAADLRDDNVWAAVRRSMTGGK